MFVLGVDPGLTRCGYGGVALDGARERAVAAGVVTTPPELPVAQRLAELHRELAALVAELRPDVVVVERVLFQTNARTAMAVGQASGVALLCAAEANIPVAQYSANEVKLAVTGYGAATKAQVQAMVAVLLGLDQPPRPPDVADALALAICHLGIARATARHPSVPPAPEVAGPRRGPRALASEKEAPMPTSSSAAVEVPAPHGGDVCRRARAWGGRAAREGSVIEPGTTRTTP